MNPPENAFSTEASHQTARLGFENAKAAAQAAILINGGAATALLAFISRDKVPPGVMMSAPYCLGAYALGVATGALTIYGQYISSHHWNNFWQARALGYSDEARGREEKGHLWRGVSHFLFGLTISCFVGASFYLAWALYRQ